MTDWQLLSVGTACLCLGLVIAGLLRLPRSRVSTFLIAMSLSAAAWAIGDLITGMAQDLRWEQIGIAVLYTGSLFGPALWWGLALSWADERGAPLPIGVGWGTWIPLGWAASGWLLMITNPWHGLLLTPIVGDRNVLHPLWWMMAIPNYALVLSAAGIQVWVARKSRSRETTRQATAMIASSLTVVFANLIYTLWPESPPINATLIVLAISVVVLVIGFGLEEERREYASSLERDVARRTAELRTLNSDLQQMNQKLTEAQERLLQAERLHTAEYLAGSVAHAINNPLAALRGTVELALRGGRKRDATLDRVLRLTRRIEEVAGRTLQLVRQGELHLDQEPTGAILEDVREELADRAASSGVQLHVEIEQKLPDIVVDRSLVVAALSGICENALEVSPKGSVVRLRVDRLPGLRGVAFWITDSGPGIPKDVLERIFEPFFTTKRAGTGLGLAIARGVIQGHGGTIQVFERAGGGTVVNVELPLGPSGGVVLGLPSNKDSSAA